MKHVVILTLFVATFTTNCTPWTESVQPRSTDHVERVDRDGKHCFSAVVVSESAADAAILSRALPAVCAALRDDQLRSYLARNAALFKEADAKTLSRHGATPEAINSTLAEILEPSRELAMAPSDGKTRAADFYIVAAEASGPGLSAICVRREPSIRAIRISRNLRLVEPVDVSRLVNTVTHETVHLHAANNGGPCQDLFNDDGNDALQCHSMSYVVGNAAACSYKRGSDMWSDEKWRACMIDQATLTPGHQTRPAPTKDAFGCD